MAWHSAPDRLDEPRARHNDGRSGRAMPVGRVHGGLIEPASVRGAIPTPRFNRPQARTDGEVAAWLKAHAWKVCLRETVTRVRIPLSPPFLAIRTFSACGCAAETPRNRAVRARTSGLRRRHTRLRAFSLRPYSLDLWTEPAPVRNSKFQKINKKLLPTCHPN